MQHGVHTHITHFYFLVEKQYKMTLVFFIFIQVLILIKVSNSGFLEEKVITIHLHISSILHRVWYTVDTLQTLAE